MQATTLKYPGGFTSAQTIRREIAHEISQLEIAVAAGAPAKPELAAFLADAAAKTPGYAGPVLPATQAVVSNGGSVPVKNSAGTVTKTGTATVAANAVTGVALGATTAIVDNAGAATVRNSAGSKTAAATVAVAAGAVTNVNITASTTAIVDHNDTVPVKDAAGVVRASGATAEIVAGVPVSVRLAATASVAIIPTATKFPVGTVSGSGTFGTFTVVNGVITGIVLSAS